MTQTKRRLALGAALLAVLGCDRAGPHGVPGKFYASPIRVESERGPLVVVAATGGAVTGVEAATRRARWTLQLAAPPGEEPYVVATPVAVGGRVVLAYQTRSTESSERRSHRVVVIDAATGAFDAAFPELELRASKPASDGSGTVEFRPANALSRAALVHGRTPRSTLGFVYVSFGNQADIQPWHGWVFELDLDRWKSAGAQAAISSVLLVTPETHCPVEGQSGSHDMICGGGVWSPAGPAVVETPDGFELIVSTGNGQLDLAREDYANTLMRLRPGLDFDPECDEALCRDFDPIAPAESCLASCRNLFVPRLRPGDAPLRPASGLCDGMTFMECYARIDYDFGAGVPVKIDLDGGPSVFAQPGKDGSVYLLDAAHMGTLYDREPIVEVCGTAQDDCRDDQWRGMIVTKPAVTRVDGVPVILVPTFLFDQTHPAGVVALAVVLEGGAPRFEPRWQAPSFATREARERFRYYPSRVVLSTPAGESEPIAWVVDVVDDQSVWTDLGRLWEVSRSGRDRGTLLGIRVRDGAIVARIPLRGRGRKHVLPLVHDGAIWVPSNPDLEIHDIGSIGARGE